MLPRTALVRLASLSLALWLTACGGGGSSGGASSNELTVGRLTPAEISATWTDSQVSRPLVKLSASFSGTTSGAVYVVVEDPDKLFGSAVPLVGTNQASVELHPSYGDLAPGRYNKPLVVHVCKDINCSAEYAGSPQTVRKDILVEGLAVSPARLNFSAPVALGAAAQSFTVTPPAGKDFELSWTYVSHKAPDGSTSSLRLEQVFDITKTATGLQVKPKPGWAGQYTLNTVVQSEGYVGRTIQVVYDVAGKSGEAFTVLTPQATATAVGNEEVYVDVDVKINIPPSDVRVSVSGTPDPVDHGWLRPSTIQAIDGGRRYRFSLNRCGYGVRTCLGVGTHAGLLTLTPSAYGASWTYNVPLSFTVR